MASKGTVRLIINGTKHDGKRFESCRAGSVNVKTTKNDQRITNHEPPIQDFRNIQAWQKALARASSFHLGSRAHAEDL